MVTPSWNEQFSSSCTRHFDEAKVFIEDVKHWSQWSSWRQRPAEQPQHTCPLQRRPWPHWSIPPQSWGVDELVPVVLQVVTVLHPPHDLKHLGPMISAAGQPALALVMTWWRLISWLRSFCIVKKPVNFTTGSPHVHRLPGLITDKAVKNPKNMNYSVWPMKRFDVF